MIAVDWGTTRLRAYRLAADGTVVDRRLREDGALACNGRFARVLAQAIGDWDDPQVLMCGMIGARGGWREVAYVPCPGDANALAAGVVALGAQDGIAGLEDRVLRIVPGMIDRGSPDMADVMRGEETQVAGLLATLADDDRSVCLPGTHSKWVRVRNGAIHSIHTAMTGETYALFRRHSVLARLMPEDEPDFDAPAFDQGLRRSGQQDGLLHQLFGIRTAELLGSLSADAAPSFLSGLLIGCELRARCPLPPEVHLIGADRLSSRYARALEHFGARPLRHAEDLAAAGLYRLSRLLA